jgi:hypothetical protein
MADYGIATGGVVRVPLSTDSQHQRSPILEVLLSRIRQSHWYREMHGILREIRNCYRRIQRQRETRWGKEGVSLDRDHQQPPYHPVEFRNASIRARMLGIEDLYTSRSWTTVLDVEVFLLGWVRAEAFWRDTYGIPSNIQSCKTPSLSPSVGLKSMPLSATQQASKRGQSIPLA